MSSQLVCNNCGGTDIDKDPARGHAVCTGCGSVLEDTLIVSEVQFAENAGGGSSVIGQFVSSEGGSAGPSMNMGSGFHPGMGKESRLQTLQKGRRKINELAALLKLNQHCSETAYNFYKMAVIRRITRGRKSPHVIAACLYLVCRTEGTPHMLLDFSDVLQINVYTLGRTYLALARLLCINVPAIDPSLLIPRFAHKLEFGDQVHVVSMTALRFVSRMKRDWMAIGRRPSGLCGAALLVASRVHNFCRTKKDIIKVVKVCESTLRKRLIEFEETASGSLTIDQFQTIDLEEEADPPAFTQSQNRAKLKKIDDMAANGEVNMEITELSNEIEKELETRSSKQVANLEKDACILLKTKEVVGDMQLEDPNAEEFLEAEVIAESLKMSATPPPTIQQNIHSLRPTAASLGLTTAPVQHHIATKEDVGNGELDIEGLDEDELDRFILTDEEVRTKEKVWMMLNGDFLKEQEEKMKKRAEEEAAKPPKVKRKRRKLNINASTAGEAMEKMIQEKKLSTKINYEVLMNLANGGTSDLVSKSQACTVSETSCAEGASTSQTAEIGAESATPNYLPTIINETPSTSHISISKRNRVKPTAPSLPNISKPSDATTSANKPTQRLEPVVESGPILETGPVEESGPVPEEDEYLEEENFEDEDEPISAAQLLGHGYAAEEDDYDYD